MPNAGMRLSSSTAINLGWPARAQPPKTAVGGRGLAKIKQYAAASQCGNFEHIFREQVCITDDELQARLPFKGPCRVFFHGSYKQALTGHANTAASRQNSGHRVPH